MAMMPDHEFRSLVRRMRQAQIEFFRATSKGNRAARANWLAVAKSLERQVDEELRVNPDLSTTE